MLDPIWLEPLPDSALESVSALGALGSVAREAVPALIAALEHGFDRVALRRRNLIPPSSFPYKNPQGITYDNGTYRVVMDRAMELGDTQQPRAEMPLAKFALYDQLYARQMAAASATSATAGSTR